MGNRKKAKNPRLAMDEAEEVHVPIMERTVHKRVPAKIHWSTVEGNDRTDSEIIGEAIIYEDGTSDVIVFSDISEDAKHLVGVINQSLDGYSIEEG